MEVTKSTVGGSRWLEVFNASLKFGLRSFDGPVAHLGYFRKLTITSAARFPRGYRRRGCSTSRPKDTPFSTTAARSLLSGSSIREIADKLQSEGGVSQATLDELFAHYRDPTYWTTTISFTATTAQRPIRS
jgi:hypothetical protein